VVPSRSWVGPAVAGEGEGDCGCGGPAASHCGARAAAGRTQAPHLLLLIGGTTAKVERIGTYGPSGAIGMPCAVGT